jgi:hypothetical protein
VLMVGKEGGCSFVPFIRDSSDQGVCRCKRARVSVACL